MADRQASHGDTARPQMRVLIAEDEPAARAGLIELVTAWGFEAVGAADGEAALAEIDARPPDIVLADLVMPRRDGLALLSAVADRLQDMTFVMITAQGSVESAVAAMKDGAHDYLTKPIDPGKLRALLDRVVERHADRREARAARRQLADEGRFGRTIGRSAPMRAIYQVIERTAPTEASVLVWGESGTGKELVARTLHELSPRAERDFVGINCAAIPETLLESEIFGHERGAFTGATERRPGCFERAHRGTLFLDEIAEMETGTQAKLLRVLQERTVRRLGGASEQPVDVRIIAATNMNPQAAIDEGRLREDLFYRISVVSIEMPPLRKRPEDVRLLVEAFLIEFSERNRRRVDTVAGPALRALERYTWPGNVRELRNVIERAVILAPGETIDVEHLPPDLVERPSPPMRGTVTLEAGTRVDVAERRLIELTLEHTNQNKTRAADMLGISVKTLHNKLNRFKAADAARAGKPAGG